MKIENSSIMAHVSIGTDDVERTCNFYDKIMKTIGATRVEQIILDDEGLVAVAYGRQFPEFWVNIPYDNKPAETANGVHFAFMAPSKQAVHDFWDTGLSAGATPDGGPGPRPHYGPAYYGCFLRDLDGHKIEAMYWDVELARKAAGG